TAGVAAVDNSTCTRTPGVGLHSYQATYSGDGNYVCTPSSAHPECVGACEPFEIVRVASHITTRIVRDTDNKEITNQLIDLDSNVPLAVPVHDEATVTCDGGQTPTGTVTFTTFSDGACLSATGTEDVTLVNGSAKTISVALGPNAISYKADYTPDA